MQQLSRFPEFACSFVYSLTVFDSFWFHEMMGHDQGSLSLLASPAQVDSEFVVYVCGSLFFFKEKEKRKSKTEYRRCLLL